ncbi:Exodeoxyribonuclease V gamma chain [Kingella potus]|uniref:RecBCD enzyme subunit RecC n=1 Tax=Kingella potus TaxID=265175 RepID=A0A377QZ02_9NEIS|nr:exodeoxyribonuclease V subunit gamma [Kingella potus]STR00222.1 Exodeoxyribonuclease V gamma chain [Kingella potus]
MLRLYQSNRLEDLAALLQKVQESSPLSEPLLPEEIIVQSQGMRRFIGNYLAEHSGIAANIRFSLPAGFNWRLVRSLLPDIPELSPFDTEVMRWRLLGLFVSDGLSSAGLAAAKAALSGYLSGGGAAAYQLAGQLADIFDQYLVYRPDWTDAWQRGRLLDLGGDEAWQAELWRFLNDGQTAPHRVEMWHRLEKALESPPANALPERICVFGIAALAPMYLQLLQAVARHSEVHIFALNPSSEYWGNIIDPAQILAEGGGTGLSAAGHPLLASLGKQGRDFFNALAESEAHTDLSVYHDHPLSDSLLHRLQYGLQTLAPPDKTAALDDSIRIVSAHSPLRELEILKDHLLALFARDPDLQAHDTVVLTPDIEPYAPYIEAVFGRESGRPLPYSLADVKLSRRRPLLHAVGQVIDIFDSRFEADKILALLDSDTVLQRFGLTREDLPLLHDTAARLNIRWGWDETMRDGTDPLFTWRQGLDRIILGWMLPDNGALWQGHAPWHTDPGHIPVLARFAAFLRRLAHWRQTWQQSASAAVWTQRIGAMAEDLFAQDDQGRQDIQQLAAALARWQQETDLAGFDGALDSATANRHLARFLDSRSEAGFLHGGITFCSMVPMRSLPFKTLCLLGLNDGQFPRDTRAAAFDLIARHPRRGDRARRDDDRYLFLEALVSARRHLYLSYVGRSIRSNEELAPSALLNELADCLADMTGTTLDTLRSTKIEQHPLQAFSTRYFDGSGLAGSRSDYAEALNRPSEQAAPFYTAPLSDDTPPEHVSQADFLDFWKNPVRHWLRRKLDWRAPYRDEAWQSAEPFDPPRGRDTAAAYTEARRLHQDFADTAAALEARSMLPAGELGTLWRGQYEAAAKSLDQTLLDSPALPDAPYEYFSDGLTLRGSLGSLHAHGQIHILDHRPNAPEQTVLLLQHLICNAVRPAAAADLRSHWIQPDRILTLPPIGRSRAQEILDGWLAWWRSGQNRPLPFFAKTTLAAAEALLAGSQKNEAERRKAARTAARAAYFGSKNSTGQADYAEVAQVFGRNDTPPVEEDDFWLLAENLVLPLLSAVRETDGQSD